MESNGQRAEPRGQERWQGRTGSTARRKGYIYGWCGHEHYAGAGRAPKEDRSIKSGERSRTDAATLPTPLSTRGSLDDQSCDRPIAHRGSPTPTPASSSACLTGGPHDACSPSQQ